MPDTASKVRDTANRAYRRARSRAARTVHEARRRWRAMAPQERQTVRLTAGSAALGLVVALTAVAAGGPWDSGQRTAERAWAARHGADSGGEHTPGTDPGGSRLTAPQVLADAGPVPGRDRGGGEGGPGSGDSGSGGSRRADQVPPPTSSALADTLEPLLRDGSLGDVRHASVVDAVTGRQLFSQGASEVSTPASTVKLATAVAALTTVGDDHRIATRAVVDGDDGDDGDDGNDGDTVTLVGGGDPTLTEDDVAALARDTADALDKRGIDKVALGYDTSRYTGTDQHPIGPNENLAPVTPLSTRGGWTGASTARHPAPTTRPGRP